MYTKGVIDIVLLHFGLYISIIFFKDTLPALRLDANAGQPEPAYQPEASGKGCSAGIPVC